jgi:endonuclease/exonuclease/phosphatase family metal-dependent hydrolase
MAHRVFDSIRLSWLRHAFVALVACAALPALVHAQVTVTLSAPGTQLTDDATIRGGTYASANYSNDPELITKTSSDASSLRRVLLKFDTANTIPAGAPVTSATLYLTLKSAGAASSRPISVYRVGKSFLERSSTWYNYRDWSRWTSAGGDFPDKWTTINVGRTAGTRVTFDVTSLVQKTVAGAFGSRWTRVALIDTGSPDNESMRVFHSSEASYDSLRPKLVVTYGKSTTSTSTSTTSSTSTLKVMQYNTHHGVGTDGRYNLDRIATVIANQRPDVVSLNEVMYNSSYGNGENQTETYKRLLQQKTGQTWYCIYARMDGNWSSTAWSTGNALCSRYAFRTTTKYALSTGAHSVAHGTIVVNGRTINLFSTHVSWSNSSWRTTETRQVKSIASTWSENRIVMGDFNTWPWTTDYQIMASAYYDSWAEGLKAGIASSPSGSVGSTKGTSRFDYIYRSFGASALVLTKVTVPNTSSGGAKPSDHDPVVATFTVK